MINSGNLAVGSGESLTLLGGTTVNNGTITAPGGNITIASIPGQNKVRISQVGNVLSLDLTSPTVTENIPLPFTPLNLAQLLTGQAGVVNGLTVNAQGKVVLANNMGIIVANSPGSSTVSGKINVSGKTTGSVNILGTQVSLVSADINASGVNGGGTVLIGGDSQGKGTVLNAQTTQVDDNSMINANAISNGNGGRVIVWGNQAVKLLGKITALGGSQSGSGGFVQIAGIDIPQIAGIVLLQNLTSLPIPTFTPLFNAITLTLVTDKFKVEKSSINPPTLVSLKLNDDSLSSCSPEVLENINSRRSKIVEQNRDRGVLSTESLAISRQCNDKAGILNNIGNAYNAQGDYKKAIAYFTQSLTISRPIGDKKGEGSALNNLAIAENSLGEHKQAIDLNIKSLTIFRQIGDTNGEGSALDNIGIAYRLLGEYKKAVDYHTQSLTIRHQIRDKNGEGNSLSNLGDVYNSLGEYNKAIAYYTQSLTISREIGHKNGETATLNNIGNAYNSLKEYKKSIDYYNQSLTISRQIGDKNGEGNSLSNLGNADNSLGEYQKAIAYYNQSLTISRQIGDKNGEGATLDNIGNAYNSLGEYKQAIAYLTQSLSISRQIGDRHVEGSALTELGKSFFKDGNLQTAKVNFQKAIQVFESIRSDLGNKDSFKVSLFESQADTYRLLQQVLVSQNQPNQALEIAERGRARALAELLIERQGLNTATQPPNIQYIRQIAQQHNATLVEYSIALKDFYIWVVKPNGEVIFRKVNLEKTNLAKMAEDTRIAAALYAARGRGGTSNVGIDSETSPQVSPEKCRSNDCLREMYDLLIKPIAADLPSNPDSLVIFIPHESLFLVPFVALQDDQGKFLIDQHTIAIAPSIQVLELTSIQRKKLPLVTNQDRALVVGNPIMPKIGNVQLPSLPGSEAEAKSIAKLLKSKPLIGGEATKVAVEAGMKGARFIHFATHGLLDKNSQVEIPGKIALAPFGEDDGFLKADEILQLKLNAELVVLSACNTGKGKITGDGVIGLSRVFISTGVPSIVASLWSVDDKSTAKLMQQFYVELREHGNKAQALRQAILKTKQDYPQPRYWAAFMLIGEAI
jgi:CHAT domain-containing protein/Flp pilus assembly protein TadD